MAGVLVAISTVADGSMYNRDGTLDSKIIKNRDTFLSKLSTKPEHATQVQVNYEGSDFRRYKVANNDNSFIVGDALITTNVNHALFLPVADCVGVALYDPIHRVLMVSHLGRHSLEQRGGEASVKYLVEQYGSDPKELLLWLTPAPGKDVYPIWALDNKGMKEVVFEQLQKAGVMRKNITDNPAETDKDTNYFSFSEFQKGNRDIDGDHMLVAMMTD